MTEQQYICSYCEGKGILTGYTQENYQKYFGRWSECPPDWQEECEDCSGNGLVAQNSHLQWESRVPCNPIDPENCPFGFVCQTMTGSANRKQCPNSWHCITLADYALEHP